MAIQEVYGRLFPHQHILGTCHTVALIWEIQKYAFDAAFLQHIESCNALTDR